MMLLPQVNKCLEIKSIKFPPVCFRNNICNCLYTTFHFWSLSNATVTNSIFLPLYHCFGSCLIVKTSQCSRPSPSSGQSSIRILSFLPLASVADVKWNLWRILAIDENQIFETVDSKAFILL